MLGHVTMIFFPCVHLLYYYNYTLLNYVARFNFLLSKRSHIYKRKNSLTYSLISIFQRKCNKNIINTAKKRIPIFSIFIFYLFILVIRETDLKIFHPQFILGEYIGEGIKKVERWETCPITIPEIIRKVPKVWFE